MSARNGDTTPPDGQPLGDLSGRDQLALIRECVHAVGALREDALVVLEYAKSNAVGIKATNAKVDALGLQLAETTGRIMAELGRVAAHLGMVERQASGPDFATLAYEGEITRVRRERAELAEIERARAHAHQRKADLWNGAKRVARLTLAAAIVAAPVVWIALKGWLE